MQQDLTAAEVAKRLGYSLLTVQVYANRGRFAGAYKLGRDWRIPASAVGAYKRGTVGRPRGRKKKEKKQ